MDSPSQIATIDYPEKVVAYLDILGFKRLVLQSHDLAKAAILKLDACLNHSLECLSLEGGPDWFSVKLFSDCFCISSDCSSSDIYLMLSEVSFIQWDLAWNGIFIRGGLSFGAHFENERIIFSEGLIRAYELQSVDPYPRVLIDPSLVERIRRLPSEDARNDLLHYIVKGQDGEFFLDYLQCLAEADAYTGNLDEMLALHKQAILAAR